jgi:predicted RNA-binding protein with PIN domain
VPWLVDGSNVLGASRRDVRNDTAKRELVRALAAFSRARRTRVSVVFDGLAPSSFPTHLGSVTVSFSGPKSADDVIAERAAQGSGWSVVTSDQGLAARVRRRAVEVVAASQFLQLLESAQTESEPRSDDWADYFSDPKNRHEF